jgi:ABC-type Na+ transport system ATPase subunit NatA
VGVEIVKDPAIIFLDEPTTGLDSEMALGVTTSLKAMAAAGKMVKWTTTTVSDCKFNSGRALDMLVERYYRRINIMSLVFPAV